MATHVRRTPPLRIRRADQLDAPRLAAFAARVFRATYASFNEPENLEGHLATRFGPGMQEREIGDPAWQSLLVEVGHELAAYAQLVRGPAPESVHVVTGRSTALELKRFYVDPQWHGRGVAQELMAACVASRGEAREPLWLGVFSQNPRAIAFYTKCGFSIIGTTVFLLGTDPQQDHLMLWNDGGQTGAGFSPPVEGRHASR